MMNHKYVNNIGVFYSRNGDLKGDEKVLEPIEHILQTPFIKIHVNLAQACNHWLQIPDDKLELITEISHIAHLTGLMIDDIQDNSFKRFGMLSSHVVYGVAPTIVAGNYAASVGLEKIANLKHPDAINVSTHLFLEIARGQGLNIISRDEFFCPTEEQYKTVILRKIGPLFNLTMELMKLFSSYDKDLSLLMEYLICYFQIRDDYCNFCSPQYTEDKGYCEDLTEGKYGFVIIHALQTRPEDKEIRDIVNQRTRDMKLKRRCIELLEEYGAFTYTRKVLEELDMKARAEIDRLGGNPFFTTILDGLKNFDVRSP